LNWSLPAFEDLARLIGESTGLDFAPGRRTAAEAQIRRVMARAGAAGPEEYLDRLGADPDPHALDDLIAELTVGETYFFREPEQFNFLRETVLPEIRSRRAHGHILRAWSAGCASGEEAYSLAIVLHEELPAGRAHLLATDLSRDALARAHRARYSDWSLRGEGAWAARPYLRPEGNDHVVVEPLRRMVSPGYLNLAVDDYPSAASGVWGMDLIFCRNVLIYLDRETIRKVARRLHDSLAPGGWLIAASSDPSLLEHAPFEPVVTDRGLFYRRKGVVVPRLPAPPAESNPPRADLDPDLGAVLAEARESLALGDYAGAVDRTRALPGAAARALHIRALANLDGRLAERDSAGATAEYPLSDEIHHLRAVLLLGLGRVAEAAEAARRAVCLDRGSAMAHFTLGLILTRLGDRAGAWRAYRNARDLGRARPPGEPVPLSDGEPAGRLARSAETLMARLQERVGGMP
jgi:chemotaxis protein methyltransferase CheR